MGLRSVALDTANIKASSGYLGNFGAMTGLQLAPGRADESDAEPHRADGAGVSHEDPPDAMDGLDLPPRSELGVGLVGLFLGIMAIGLTISGSLLMQGRQPGGVTGFVLPGQAGQNARSGIREALNWFRLRPSQPVLSFDPVREVTVTSSICVAVPTCPAPAI